MASSSNTVGYLFHTVSGKDFVVLELPDGTTSMLSSDTWAGLVPQLLPLSRFDVDNHPDTRQQRRVGPNLYAPRLVMETPDGQRWNEFVCFQRDFDHTGPERGLLVIRDSDPDAHLNVQLLGVTHGHFWATRSPEMHHCGPIESYELNGNDLTVTCSSGSRPTIPIDWAFDIDTADLVATPHLPAYVVNSHPELVGSPA